MIAMVVTFAIFVFLSCEPTVACFVLDVEVAVLHNDEVHILPYADSHEYERVSHELAQDWVLARRVSKRHQNRVAIHHREESVRRVAKVVEEVRVIPKQAHGQQAVANEDRGDSSHDLDVHWDRDLQSACDNAVRA